MNRRIASPSISQARRRKVAPGLALSLAALTFAALAVSALRAQEKATPLSQVERLNRAPVNKEVLRVQLPRPVVTKLPNGLTLVLLEDHKLPTATFILWIRPGQLADPGNRQAWLPVHRRYAPRRHRSSLQPGYCR